MFRRTASCLVPVLLAGLAGPAAAQTGVQMPGPYVYQAPGATPAYVYPSPSPNAPPQAPGVNSPGAKDRAQPAAPTYSAIGSQTFGADGTSYTRMGDSVFGSDGSVSQTAGGTTLMTKPDGTARSCQTIGAQTICN